MGFFVIRQLKRLDVKNEAILGVLLNKDYKVSQYIIDAADPEQRAKGEISRCWTKPDTENKKKKTEKTKSTMTPKEAIEFMNESYAIIKDIGAGRCRILQIKNDTTGLKGFTVKDLQTFYGDKIVDISTVDGPKFINMVDYWLKHPKAKGINH